MEMDFVKSISIFCGFSKKYTNRVEKIVIFCAFYQVIV